MSRKEIVTIIAGIAVACITVGAAMLPDSVKEQYPWIWQVLVYGAGILVVVVILLIIPTKAWRSILDFFPIKIFRILHIQSIIPGRFLYVQKPRFVFLPMSGGVNYRKWSYEFNIVSCLFRDLKVNRIDVEITHPINERDTIEEDICLYYLSATQIGDREANMSDTSFYYLSEQAKALKRKEYISVRLRITGFRKGSKRFIIDNVECKGELNEWGGNNPKEIFRNETGG